MPSCRLRLLCVLFLASVSCAAQQTASDKAPAPGSPADLVQRAQKLSHEGKQDEALALYDQVLDKNPDSYEAHLGAGVALDLQGEYAKAREHLSKAVEVAPPDSKQQAWRTMAFSYAFEGNAYKASESELQVFNARLAKQDSVGAAEACNELARIYLETGDPDHAYKWYKMGYDEAKRHVAAAKPALDKANNPNQAPFYPYLTGYVAYYTGDYKSAVAELQKADQKDPLILVLLAQAFEKLDDAAQAKAYYRKVLEINNHNPTNAFARPLAKKKLAAGS